MKFKKKCQKRGIVILNALIAIVIVGLLGISLTSIYANMFSTLSAGRDASQAQQYAQIEGEYLKTQGYDNADSSVHDWKTMENLLGSDDGNLWEFKVESVRDTEIDDGNKLKIVKVSVRQKGDTTSRASYEVPLSSQNDNIDDHTDGLPNLRWDLAFEYPNPFIPQVDGIMIANLRRNPYNDDGSITISLCDYSFSMPIKAGTVWHAGHNPMGWFIPFDDKGHTLNKDNVHGKVVKTVKNVTSQQFTAIYADGTIANFAFDSP